MSNQIVQFIRRGHKYSKRKVATFVSWKSNKGKIMVGWSKYAKDLEVEPFDRQEGIRVASEFAVEFDKYTNEMVHAELPGDLRKPFRKFMDRCARYYHLGEYANRENVLVK